MLLQAEDHILIREALEKSMDYTTYRELVRRQVAEGRTSGLNQSESYVHYTLLNHKRMNRWDKRITLPDDLQAALKQQGEDYIFLVLTENWCGDAAPVLPVLNAIAMASPALELRVVLRDEHPHLMDLYLTDNARSIPKLLLVRSGDLSVVGTWGPRPETAKEMTLAYKQQHGSLTSEFRESLQKWYNKDQGKSIINEVASLFTLK